MDADGLPIVGPGVDYTKVEAIQQKRSIAFINHFITHTARFLNRFSCVCDEKLENLAGKIQRLEVSLTILEAKLSSIPGLENVTVEPSSTSTAAATPAPAKPVSNGPVSTSEPSATSQPPVANGPTAVAIETPQEPVDTTPKMTNSQDPRYSKFFKMLQVGVPVPAVKMKMSAEGFNPDIIDKPDDPVADSGGGKVSANNQASDSDFSDNDNDDSDSDSVSSFSD
ncbi:hypothetical protein LOTGIDRAFT_183391 [Lottia gigantea]|uniref:WASH complex subunit 3 n=1 Tax=Lottia gigantea TaxID=225164 RepID=V3ZY91_LOTGI|nr:hypothetical protein LOTGIDRAFT_183391 [Lottia gigantea]ESO89342.1 hypothetical protein LOTGIDRAFT_183391 [Lottia gigantea]